MFDVYAGAVVIVLVILLRSDGGKTLGEKESPQMAFEYV